MFYAHLPVLLIDDWEEVTKEMLEDFYQDHQFDWDSVWKQLMFGWWKNKILKECGRE
jgi:hypothetical protein